MNELSEAMQECASRVERMMSLLLPRPSGAEARLYEAMRYSSLGSGKRLRPFIVSQSAGLFGVDPRCAIRVGAAVEFIHSYSLVHDDLPGMDNSDLRRGKPSCHAAFDEATAILVGDALQTLAFSVLSAEETHADAFVRCQLVAELARASGHAGMCGGQMIDMRAETEELGIGAITRMQNMKTGRLFSFSAVSGAVLGRASRRHYQALQTYAQELGLAFQITDDLLDVTGDPAVTGKPLGQDQEASKETFVSILGVDRARAQARILCDQAVKALELWGDSAHLLRELAYFVVDRES